MYAEEKYTKLYNALKHYIETKEYETPHISWTISDANDLADEMDNYCLRSDLTKKEQAAIIDQMVNLRNLSSKANTILEEQEPMPETVWNDDLEDYVEY